MVKGITLKIFSNYKKISDNYMEQSVYYGSLIRGSFEIKSLLKSHWNIPIFL